MKIKLIFSLLIASLFVGCSNTESEQIKTDTVIKGTIDNYRGGNVVLQKLGMQSAEVIDTLSVSEQGTFTYYADIQEPSFYRLVLGGNNNFFNFILQPKDELSVSADGNNMSSTYEVSGSAENERMEELNQILSKAYSKMESLKKEIQQAQMSGNVQQYQAAVTEQNKFTMQMQQQMEAFINQNPASLASFAALQNLDPNQQFDLYKKVASGLKEVAPNSPFYQSLQQQVDNMAKLAIGAVAPEIELPNPEGETVPLSSLRGKVVLIDFWASWCKPCRMENPNVVRMYRKYKDKGFEIYGVSLDKNKNAWVQAIQQDNLTWTHVSDLQFWNSRAAKKYNVSGIPKTFLIDAEGKIIGKDLRGPSLEKKLEEIFS